MTLEVHRGNGVDICAQTIGLYRPRPLRPCLLARHWQYRHSRHRVKRAEEEVGLPCSCLSFHITDNKDKRNYMDTETAQHACLLLDTTSTDTYCMLLIRAEQPRDYDESRGTARSDAPRRPASSNPLLRLLLCRLSKPATIASRSSHMSFR